VKLWNWFKEKPLWLKILIGLCVPLAVVLAVGVALELLARKPHQEPAPMPVSPAATVDDAVTAHVAEINEELGAKEAQTNEAKTKVDDASGFAAVDAVLYGTRHGGSTGPAPRD